MTAPRLHPVLAASLRRARCWLRRNWRWCVRALGLALLAWVVVGRLLGEG